MEYLSEGTLAQILKSKNKENKNFSEKEAASIIFVF